MRRLLHYSKGQKVLNLFLNSAVPSSVTHIFCSESLSFLYLHFLEVQSPLVKLIFATITYYCFLHLMTFCLISQWLPHASLGKRKVTS